MSPAAWSLVALLAAIVLSCTSQLNVGLLGIAFAWIIGVFVAGGTPATVAAGFPTDLFLTLAGVTLLFAISEVNGTIDLLSRRALRLVRGRAAGVPWMLFLIAMTVSSLGPGAILSVALLAPMGMALGMRAGIPAFLTALMIANGANAGNLSAFSAVGIIANTRMAAVGLDGHEVKVWATNFAAHLLVSVFAWVWLAGRRAAPAGGRLTTDDAGELPVTRPQWTTMAVVGAWIVAVVFLRVHVGFAAFAASTLLIVLRTADEGASVKRMPWNTILMVCGMAVLIAILEKTGGLDLFTGLLAMVASPATVNGVIAFVTGVISTYSSTSGVVLPTFLPTVPSLVEKVGGGDPLAVALSINVGSALVDVSPLSTIGALCVAAVSDVHASRDLFRKMLIWGLSMTVVGAMLCLLFAPIVARM